MITIYLLVILAIAVNGSANCTEVDNHRDDLLLWFDEWLKGFEIDYITINEMRKSYDFIVVGAGIGGSIVAHRLAMDPSYPKVLLLEAGDKHNTAGLSSQMIPAQTVDNQLTEIDWQYKSEPSDGYCCKWYKDDRLAMPRGKVSGGSAVLNYMMWVRGHREDWDVLFNIDGWKWDDVLPYFKKTESVHHHNKHYKDPLGRGYEGPSIVNDARNIVDKHSIFDQSAIRAFMDTKQFEFLENGQNSDTGSNIGVAYTEYTVDDTGHRNNAFLAYNRYLRTKDDGLINLDIITNAHVTKLLFDDGGDTDHLIVNGVEFADLSDKNKKIHKIYLYDATKGEIILGGGSINNPQLLMLSGLGPKDELRKHNIPIKKDIVGIGNNLQDHVITFQRYHFKPEYQHEASTEDRLTNALNNFTLFGDYLFEGKSILSTSGANVNAFLRSNVMNNKYGTKDTYPDLQFYILAGWHGWAKYFNHKDNVLLDYECGDVEFHKDKANMMNMVAAIGLQHPESRGWIKLQSSDPFEHPLIQPNYLKEQFDVDAIKEGYKIMEKMMSQPSMKKFWDKTMECKTYGDMRNNDTALEEYIRDSIFHLYHPIGTCKMGDVHQDEMAVVDNELRVRGVMNLRIADASIYPHQTSGNTQAPTYMIGEKAADIILKRWNS